MSLTKFQREAVERAVTDYLHVVLLHDVEGELAEPDVPEYERRGCYFTPDADTGMLRNVSAIWWERRGKLFARDPVITHFGLGLISTGFVFTVGKFAEPLRWSTGLRLTVEPGGLTISKLEHPR